MANLLGKHEILRIGLVRTGDNGRHESSDEEMHNPSWEGNASPIGEAIVRHPGPFSCKCNYWSSRESHRRHGIPSRRPLPACPAGEGVHRLGLRHPVKTTPAGSSGRWRSSSATLWRQLIQTKLVASRQGRGAGWAVSLGF